jgi:hypothetical protein
MKTATAIAITILFLVKVAGFVIFLVGLKTSWEWLKDRLDIGQDEEVEESDDWIQRHYG